jgi:DNA-binding XRE family transcriptional regulator
MSGFTNRIPEGFTPLTQEALIADLRDTRVQAGISSVDAAKKLGIPRETFEDVEAGRILLNLTEIRELAWTVGAVIEYSVTTPSPNKTEVTEDSAQQD